jgi:hypothetical protein
VLNEGYVATAGADWMIGPNTVTNQLAADTGEPGEDAVQLLSDVADDDYPYPAANAILKVTISVE